MAKLNFDGQAIEISSPKVLKKPALFLRKIRSVGDKAIMSLLEGSSGLLKVQMQRRSADVQADMAVAYFSSEESAFQTLAKIKNISIEGKNLSVVYREVEEPAVIVSNLSSNVSLNELEEKFKVFRPSLIDMKDDHAIVYLDSPKDVKLAINSLSSKVINGNKITVKSYDLNDLGYSLTMNENESSSIMTKESLNISLTNAGLTPTAITMNSNISAFIGFLTMDEALKAQTSFINGSVSIDTKDSQSTNDSGLVTSSISVQPSFVLHVQNLSSETSVKQCEDELAEGGITNSLSTDRSAILKFKRHSEVVPGMKTLKTISTEGDVKFSIHRYRPVVSTGTSEYDENGIDEDFDKFSLRAVLKDYMHAEPATRFQIARNTFDRALKDAKALQNISFLLDTSSTDSIKEEARSILKQREFTPESSNRLFELFLQRDDMASFCADFKDMNAFFGEKDESDPFDWSQFRIETGDDIDRLTADMRNHENQTFSLNNGNITAKPDSKTIVIKQEEGDKGTSISLEDPSQLRDKEGRFWSGSILNTDTVQKPMPGNRVNSHRALVVVGNMKGACGFGMGKGKTSADAVNAAFRDSLRNLVYIDLYDNFGLAHDVHGKHNSCHAYIKSTPKSRMMVASPFATAVLTRFGISSASCKLVGRRDPYAMVNAMFNALKQHENVDEFAKDRGKRYLSLKWAYDNKI
jgi:small subunit ribosomal protein S5